VRADPWLLIRVLGNLLDNAIKYSPAGGSVICRIAAEAATPTEGPKVTCSIIDQGPGITVERQKRLFERFGSVDQSKGRSAGLGLAFVKKAMDAMGASIECRTGPGGTSFELRFNAGEESDLG
jgi:signal transduction histidine kinase